GTNILQNKDTVLVAVEIRVVDTSLIVFNVFKDYCLAAVFHQRFSGRGRFDDGSVLSEIAAKDRDTRQFVEWFIYRRNDVAVVTCFVLAILSYRATIGGNHICVKEISEFFLYNGEATRIIEVLHKVFARRLEIRNQWHFAGKGVKIFE